MGKKSGFSLFTFVSGVLAGVAIGILFAPDKGSNTRRKLSFQLDKYREKLMALIEELSEEKDVPQTAARAEGQRVVNDAKDKAEKLLEDVEGLIDQIRTKDKG